MSKQYRAVPNVLKTRYKIKRYENLNLENQNKRDKVTVKI